MRSEICDLALARVSLIGVGWRGGLSSHIYPPVSIIVGICPVLGFFSFTSCAVQHLGLSEKSWGFCSFLGGSTSTCCVRRFQKRLQSCLEILISLSTQAGFCPSDVIGFLCSCRQVSGRPAAHLAAFLAGFLLGSEVLRGTYLRLQAMSQKVFSLTSGFIIFWTSGSWRSLFYSIQIYFLCSHISYYSVEEEIIK